MSLSSSSESSQDWKQQACCCDLFLRVAVLEAFLAPEGFNVLHRVAKVCQVEKVSADLHIGSQERSCSSILNCCVRNSVEIVGPHSSDVLDHANWIILIFALPLAVSLRRTVSCLVACLSTSHTDLPPLSKDCSASCLCSSFLWW